MNNLKFAKSRIVFLLGLLITVLAIIYTFRSSDKLQALVLVILGLVITTGALMYVLVKQLKQTSKDIINNDSPATSGSMVFEGLIESLAYMFFM